MAPQLRTSLEAKRRRGRVNQRNESILLFTLGVRGGREGKGRRSRESLKSLFISMLYGFFADGNLACTRLSQKEPWRRV